MNEAETRAELIDPALKGAGWGVVEASRVRREVITLGRLQGAGVRAAQDIADYVLTYRNHKLAVIEAKRRDLPDTEGLGQAKKYAEKLQTRFAYSTNGVGIYQVDMTTGAEQYVPEYPTSGRTLEPPCFPNKTSGATASPLSRSKIRSGQWQPRYYQDMSPSGACSRQSLQGRSRVLLTLATGTGKTAIAFQLAWKLFQSRWNLADWKGDGEPSASASRYCSLPIATSLRIRLTTRSLGLSRKTRSCGLIPRLSARRAVCQKTATCILHHFPNLHEWARRIRPARTQFR